MAVYTYDKDRGVYKFSMPFIFHCNCPGVLSTTKSWLAQNGYANRFPLVSLPSDKIVKKYVQEAGLYHHVMTERIAPHGRKVQDKHKYAVFVNPETGEHCSIYNRVQLARSLGTTQADYKNIINKEVLDDFKQAVGDI